MQAVREVHLLSPLALSHCSIHLPSFIVVFSLVLLCVRPSGFVRPVLAGERALHDLVVFDCETRVFRPAEQRASPPEPRCRHTLELVGSELYCMLGYKGETAVGPDVFSLQVGSDKEKIAKILGSGAAQEGDVDRGQSDNEAEGGEAGERHEDEGGE